MSVRHFTADKKGCLPARSMNHPAPNAAVLWTGGKDSALALHEARLDGCRLRCLLTFAPPKPDFLAHPLAFMKLQAEALALPHFLWPVREPFHESYEAGLRWLKEQIGSFLDFVARISYSRLIINEFGEISVHWTCEAKESF